MRDWLTNQDNKVFTASTVTLFAYMLKLSQATLKKCRRILKDVRHYRRASPANSDSLELMAENLKSLVENLKRKAEARMRHFKSEKDFMQSLIKVV